MLDESLVDPEDDLPPPLPPPPGTWRHWVTRFLLMGLALAGGAGLMKFGASRLSPRPPAPAPDTIVSVVTLPPVVPPATQLPPAAQVIHPQSPPPAPAPRPAPAGMGRLVVNATPWAELYVDDRSVGNTPVVDLPVRAGMHQLLLVRDGFEPELRTVVVPRGETVRVTGIQLRALKP